MDPATAAAIATFLMSAFGTWRSGRRQNQAARSAYNAQYNSPSRLARNARLTQLWNEHNLADRFKDAFPDPSAPENAGRSVKTPENVLRARIDPPPFEGGGGATLLDSILSNAQHLPMPGGGGGSASDPRPGVNGNSMVGPYAGGYRFDSSGDPLDPFALDALATPTIPFRRREG